MLLCLCILSDYQMISGPQHFKLYPALFGDANGGLQDHREMWLVLLSSLQPYMLFYGRKKVPLEATAAEDAVVTVWVLVVFVS